MIILPRTYATVPYFLEKFDKSFIVLRLEKF